MAPHAGIGLEVARAVARSVLVAPQEERHRGHRLGDHELPHPVDDRVPVLVERLDLGAERAALQLATIDREERYAADERRAGIGAATRGEEPRVATDVLIDPLEALGRERRARRADGAKAGEVATRARFDP